MKIKEGFVMRSIAGNYIIVPAGSRVVDFKGMMNLNETGAFIFKLLKNETSYENILNKMLEEYDVNKSTLTKDLDEFLNSAETYGII